MKESNPISQWKDKKILILGDVMIDRYLMGGIHRISPEAPVPVLDLVSQEDRLGGASNVALNIKSLGGIPILFSVVGDDETGLKFIELMKQEALSTDYIFPVRGRKSTVKSRVMAGSQQLLRIDEETTAPIQAQEVDQIFQQLVQFLENHTVDGVLFQDYNKGLLVPELIEKTIQLAKKLNIPTIVDPKADNFWAYKGVTLFKPNLKEIKERVNFQLDHSLEILAKGAAFIRDKLNNDFTVITLSADGIFADDAQVCFVEAAKKRMIADVCGAGDTVVSVLALALAAGLELREMVKIANIAGGQVCEIPGVVAANLESLQKEYLYS
jgi:rfaE bifunctional protein kinase chain/domain